MTFLEAAQDVLRREGRSLTVEELTKRAFSDGLLSTRGKTPEATMGAAIYVNIKRLGVNSPFVKEEDGRFGLAVWRGKSTQVSHKEKDEIGEKTFKSAAYRILKKSDRPLSAQSITELALKHGYLQPKGRTPSQSMGAALYVDIKRLGDRSQFVQLGKNLFGLRKWDISKLKPLIQEEEKNQALLKKDMRRRSIVGDPIHIGGLVYGPLNENGVVFLFSKVQDKLPQPIIIEAIQPTFPDAKGRRKTENGWVDVWIEFEYKCSNFKSHGHDPSACDIIVCWEDDWKQCPIEVVELKTVLRQILS